MPDTAYYQILNQVQRLSPDDQLLLLEDIAALVRQHIAKRPRRSILELEGLGKEIWEGIDAQEYVNKERSSWDG